MCEWQNLKQFPAGRRSEGDKTNSVECLFTHEDKRVPVHGACTEKLGDVLD